MIQKLRRFLPATPTPAPDHRFAGSRPTDQGQSSRHRHFRGLGADRRGVAAVEFVFSSVPLLIMVFGFVAVSAVFNTLTSMQNNVQYAARMISTGQITQNNNGTISATNTTATVNCSGTIANTKVEYYACNGLPSWTSFTVTSTENCATPSVSVSLSTNAATAAIADVVAIFSGKTLNTQISMMKEGSCP